MLAGDGIGPEVIAEALKVCRAVGAGLDTVDYDLGARRYLRTGEVLPDAVLDDLRSFDAILLGAVGSPDVPPGVLERGLLLKLRFELDLYINLRPFVFPPRVHLAVVRENTEGSYAGEGGFLRRGTPQRSRPRGRSTPGSGWSVASDLPSTWPGAATARHLTLVHKTNVLTFAGDLWQRTFDQVGLEYPDVEVGYSHVDAACIHLVSSPERYDVIVTDNLFGDILTDLAGAVSGGIGLAASANLNPARTGPSLFEPVHGSAPDIAGHRSGQPNRGDHLGRHDARLPGRGGCQPTRITKAVAAYLDDRHTDDSTSHTDERASTSQIGDAIAERV